MTTFMMNAIYFCNLKGDILHHRGMYQGYYALYQSSLLFIYILL